MFCCYPLITCLFVFFLSLSDQGASATVGFTHTDFTNHSGVSTRDLSRYLSALKTLERVQETHDKGVTLYTTC